jgi:uncharacterized membrane protein
MDTKLGFYLRNLIQSMAFRATAFSMLAAVGALLSILVGPFIPLGLSATIGADAVDDVLSIIASSMLSVTTFSLAIAVSAFNSAASNATPRSTALLVEDPTTQNVLSTFVGAFLFSLVGIVVLHIGAYGEEGRVVMFILTVLVIIVVVTTLLRWIGHLTQIGRMGNTLDLVERAAKSAIEARLQNEHLGCRPLPDGYKLPRDNHPVFSSAIGYIQHIDVFELNKLAESYDTQFAIVALPGIFADRSRPIVFSEKQLGEDETKRVADVFTIANNRTFRQDPRFGVTVLSEIAARALSPAVNDPGTAIDVIGRLVRIISLWDASSTEDGREDEDVDYPRLLAPAINLLDIFDDAFNAIARDAAGMVEVHVRLQKAMASLAASRNAEVRKQAERIAGISIQRARDGLSLESDLKSVETARKAILD